MRYIQSKTYIVLGAVGITYLIESYNYRGGRQVLRVWRGIDGAPPRRLWPQGCFRMSLDEYVAKLIRSHPCLRIRQKFTMDPSASFRIV